MCIAVLFAMAKRWKHPKYSSTDEWINKMWYVHTVKYYSAINRKEILTYTTVKLEDIVLSEIIHHIKGKNTIRFHCMRYLYAMHDKRLQSCPTLCDPVDCSPPGSSVHGILQARILEWVAMPFSRGSSRLRDGTRVSYVSCEGRRVLYH